MEIRASGQSHLGPCNQARRVVIPWKSGQVVRVHRQAHQEVGRRRNPLEIRASGQRPCCARDQYREVVIPWKSGQVVREARRVGKHRYAVVVIPWKSGQVVRAGLCRGSCHRRVVIPWKSGQVVRAYFLLMSLRQTRRNPLEIRASGQRYLCTKCMAEPVVVIPWKSGQVVRGLSAGTTTGIKAS